MGTKVHCKSYLPGYYYSMRDLNEDSSSSSWPVCYGDKATTNGQYYNNGFMPRTIIDGYPGYSKDVLKQKMLEHEAVFRNQVYELHRVYRIQRDMMEEFKSKEQHRLRPSMEQPSSSSSLRGPQMPSQDARKWHMAAFPPLNSVYDRPSMSGVETGISPVSCKMGYNIPQPYHFPFPNESSLKESEPLDSRPLKVRKKLFDLQLPADEYMDEEGENLPERKLHSGIKLADLNEPVEIGEANTPSMVAFLDHGPINGEIKGEHRRPVKSDTGYLCVNEERSLLIGDGYLVKSSVEGRVDERGWFSHLHEAGSNKSNLSSITHNLHKEKMPILSHPIPGMLNRAPGSHPFFTSSCFASSRAHFVPSWANPTSSSAQKLTTTESRLDLPRNLHTSAQIGEKSLNPGFVNDITAKNGFYHGSASKSKEISGIDYLNCSRADNVISNHSANHAFGYFPKIPSCLGNPKPVINIDLNEAGDGKCRTALPWLKRKPPHANEAAITDLNQPFTSKVENDCVIVTKNGIPETRNVKKILGFPVFDTGPSENVQSSSASTGWPKNIGKEKKSRVIDINLECEPDEEIAGEIISVEKEKKETRVSFMRDFIDLNSCISDLEEDAIAPSYESKDASVKIVFEIDLEAPVENEDDITPSEENITSETSLQSLQNKNEASQDEILKNVAEIMVAISSSCPEIGLSRHVDDDASLAESLVWLANQLVINELTVRDGPDGQCSLLREDMDEFEALTLQIQETKEEDYMPVPFVPEFQSFEEMGPANSNTLVSRPRRGQSRRGRQRRDFQRDILPGLASLSRHEVTEDIQTFGGLMKAMGHHWVSGLARRNGGGRGRRRAVIESVSAISGLNNQACRPSVGQVSKNIEGGLEDRSLTGWGKTTRRPRRQRCPTTGNSNNPPAVVLA